MAQRQRHDADAVRITTAAPGRGEGIAARERRYLISMGIRVLCFVGAVVVGPGWFRWILIAGAVFLPYIAVVMANTAGNRQDPELRGTHAFGRELK
ncbi:MAG: DUF3099 domain-containing protein [Nocardioides sp.]|nr:DUF3099 domain-containing protein [Nocardioides sp.]